MAANVQDRFFEVLNARLAERGYELLTQHRATNAGTGEIVLAGTFEAVSRFSFHFQDGHNVLESPDPLWPEGGSNARMFIARDAAQVGRAIELILTNALPAAAVCADPSLLLANAFSPAELETLIVTAGELRIGGDDDDLSTTQKAVLDKAADLYRQRDR